MREPARRHFPETLPERTGTETLPAETLPERTGTETLPGDTSRGDTFQILPYASTEALAVFPQKSIHLDGVMNYCMDKINLNDGGITFDALLLRTDRPTRLVLFAAGSGGNPERHLPLLNSLVENGCTVVAPYFERLVSAFPNASDLALRARRMQIAFDKVADTNLPSVGIGHSIGATLLLAMAGGQMWIRGGERLQIDIDKRLRKLVLFAPPTGFFHAPNALSAIQIPLQAWAGTLDSITPQAQTEFLRDHLSTQVSFDLHIVDGAGHFSFMNMLPPQINDSMVNRDDFLRTLAVEVCRFTLA